MTPEQASTIVEQLAMGTDPRTGIVLGPGDACTAPEVIRALFMARNALQGRLLEGTAAPRRGPVMRNGVVLENAGKRWSAQDVDKLLKDFASGTPLRQISRQLGRSDSGIVARLVAAGALPDREAGYALIRADRGRAGDAADGHAD